MFQPMEPNIITAKRPECQRKQSSLQTRAHRQLTSPVPLVQHTLLRVCQSPSLPPPSKQVPSYRVQAHHALALRLRRRRSFTPRQRTRQMTEEIPKTTPTSTKLHARARPNSTVLRGSSPQGLLHLAHESDRMSRVLPHTCNPTDPAPSGFLRQLFPSQPPANSPPVHTRPAKSPRATSELCSYAAPSPNPRSPVAGPAGTQHGRNTRRTGSLLARGQRGAANATAWVRREETGWGAWTHQKGSVGPGGAGKFWSWVVMDSTKATVRPCGDARHEGAPGSQRIRKYEMSHALPPCIFAP